MWQRQVCCGLSQAGFLATAAAAAVVQGTLVWGHATHKHALNRVWGCFSCVLVLQRIATEITVLQQLEHPLLPKLHQVYTTGDEICLEMTVCGYWQ